MRTAIWLLLVQASLGAFDTLYYHDPIEAGAE